MPIRACLTLLNVLMHITQRGNYRQACLFASMSIVIFIWRGGRNRLIKPVVSYTPIC